METGEILLNEIPTTLNNPSSGTTDSFIPSGIKEDKPLTREIIGKDNRYKITDTTTFPNSAICYAEMKFPNSDSIYVGTAWMYGNRVAVTAGHCVYDSSLGGWLNGLEYTLEAMEVNLHMESIMHLCYILILSM